MKEKLVETTREGRKEKGIRREENERGLKITGEMEWKKQNERKSEKKERERRKRMKEKE